MSDKRTTETLNWLNATLEAQRTNLFGLVSRLKEFASGANFLLHKKFMRLMDQIAKEQKKEREIIDKIEAIEKQHQHLRKLNLLQIRATEARVRRARKEDEEDMALLMRRRKKPEKDNEASLLELVVLAGVLGSFSRFFDKMFALAKGEKPEPK